MNNYPNLTDTQFNLLTRKMNENKYDTLYLEMSIKVPGVFLTEYLKRDPKFIEVVKSYGF